MAANTYHMSYENQTLTKTVGLGVRSMFYFVSPDESSFEHIDEIPSYVDMVVPLFVLAIFMEGIVNEFIGKEEHRLEVPDAINSLISGLLCRIGPAALKLGLETSIFIYLYERYHLIELPWESPWTWLCCMLLYDFIYYWFHRASHEVNIMWAVHQVHHSSQKYNLTTALRQPALLHIVSPWFLFMPLALFIPPTVFIVHQDLNLISQFWLHTGLHKLGPIEWIFNTPSHHRVHHGRNRYCIDKNHGGFLIIWDRMFGTFQEERDDEHISYGLTTPINTWDSIYTQFGYWQESIEKILHTEGWKNKVYRVVKGPGWEPGKPRLGYRSDIPDIRGPQPRYSKTVSWWIKSYNILHIILALILIDILTHNKESWTSFSKFCLIVYIVWTFINLGDIFEHRWYAPYMEISRCLMFPFINHVVGLSQGSHVITMLPATILPMIHAFSAAGWLARQTQKSLKHEF